MATMGGRSRGRGGRQGGGRGSNTAQIISKALSYTLRHNAIREGLALRPDGYANVGELVSAPQTSARYAIIMLTKSLQLEMPKFRKLDLTFEKLRKVVVENDKQRFVLIPASLAPLATPPAATPTFSGATPVPQGLPVSDAPSTAAASDDPWVYLIRASQGHSIPLSNECLNLTPLSLAAHPTAVHGTFYPSYEAIISCGYLSRMGRNHIHLATAETGVTSGMRGDAEVLVFVDVRRAVEDGGLKFWLSENGVVLTEGDAEGRLDLKFVDRIVDRRNGLGKLWAAGSVIKELPKELKGRALPKGKGHVKQPRGGGRGRRGGRDPPDEPKEGSSAAGFPTG